MSTPPLPDSAETAPAPRWGIPIGFALFAITLLLPVPEGMQPAAMRLIATVVLMGVFWFTEALPTGATSLIPLVAFPLLAIMPSDVVSQQYMDQNILLYLGGFIIALGIEKWNLHRRMALHVVKRVGENPRRLVLGFMLGTACMSMWISNTASTLLMLPLATALLTSLRETGRTRKELALLSPVLLLGIAYAASIGGSTTLVGTPTNLIFVKVWADQFPDQAPLSAGQWMIHFVPVGIVLLITAWLMLIRGLPRMSDSTVGETGFIDRKLRELGPPSQAEYVMGVLFVCTAFLWIFREPIQITEQFVIPGWRPFLLSHLSYFSEIDLTKTKYLHDSTVAIGVALLMFFIPVKGQGAKFARPLMDWDTVNKVPWAILFLIGGGFAIASAAQATELSNWIGQVLVTHLSGWPPWAWVLSICLLMTFLTEFTSNVATASALMPILALTAIGLGTDPQLLMLPAILSTSCAFMMPIATPPNAIVYSSGVVSMQQMARVGIQMNVVFALIITAATFLWLT
ncbi:Sodium-dependent dicarboxylate transporter SdcS [Polystyrenella longa]|uniref:Sodium-dependent dicarboxylate transporter SdcS n=1 Tax=Polystyrenella longa TaxID=2528007 RepID=A0A518CJ39_9PLAN|nr:SLC13 family permease [Polystyrenella longa]QDU79207.1 Sodium-dependent dicarboxylate transporter SdcS [Polystyrenella longa]